MRIGILTHYDVNNQGAQLQMCALHSFFKEQGHDVVILTYEKDFRYLPQEKTKNVVSVRSIPFYIKHYVFARGIGLTLFNVRKVLVNRRARKSLLYAPYNTTEIDVAVIGSDEVFSVDVGINEMMYGHGLHVPAVAYAPSFGIADEKTLKERECEEIIKNGLKSMYRVSARDEHTQQMVFALTGRNVPMVCDPVLLYTGSYHSRPKTFSKPYMLIYSYDRHMIDPDEVNALRQYAKKHGLMTVSAGTYHKWCDKNIVCNAEDWFGYFEGAQCVVTDTFHGTVASLCNQANFATCIRKKINAGKLNSLLMEMNLPERKLNAITEEELERVLSSVPDYKRVNIRRNEMLEKSKAYLSEALEGLNEAN